MTYEVFEGRRAIKYLGQYKPTAPYPLSDDSVIVPAGSGMVPYTPFSTLNQNISYWVGPATLSDAALQVSFRKWLIFDSFILRDRCPIVHFDAGRIGAVETVPPARAKSYQTPDYKQIDYSNVVDLALGIWPGEPHGPAMSYAQLYNVYLALPPESEALIEWYLSSPVRESTRPGAFFNPHYWQLLSLAVAVEQIVGRPKMCPHDGGLCPTCNQQIQRHHNPARGAQIKEYLRTHIRDSEVESEYASVIETVRKKVRNLLAHNPLFDRSTYPDLDYGGTRRYETPQALADFKDDSIALTKLIASMEDVVRHLILDTAFNIRCFTKLRPLNAVRVGEGSSALEEPGR